jgi:hypothetical protein
MPASVRLWRLPVRPGVLDALAEWIDMKNMFI